VRLLYHAATVKASGNIDNTVGGPHWACAGGSLFRLQSSEHLPAPPGRPGTPPRRPRRAAAAPPQANLLRHSKIEAVVRGGTPQPRVTHSHSMFNSNKQYIYIYIYIYTSECPQSKFGVYPAHNQKIISFVGGGGGGGGGGGVLELLLVKTT